MLPGAWKNLSQTRRSLAVLYLLFLFLHHRQKEVPTFFKISLIHGLATLMTLAMLPPPPVTPPIAVPIVWGASWGTALIIYSICPLIKLFT